MKKDEILQKIQEGALTDETQVMSLIKDMNNDDAIDIIKSYGFYISKGKILEFFSGFTKRHPDFAQKLRDNIKVTRS